MRVNGSVWLKIATPMKPSHMPPVAGEWVGEEGGFAMMDAREGQCGCAARAIQTAVTPSASPIVPLNQRTRLPCASQCRSEAPSSP
ncbi:hypothetical protein D3C86_1708010 [compost metagenome]